MIHGGSSAGQPQDSFTCVSSISPSSPSSMFKQSSTIILTFPTFSEQTTEQRHHLTNLIEKDTYQLASASPDRAVHYVTNHPPSRCRTYSNSPWRSSYNARMTSQERTSRLCSWFAELSTQLLSQDFTKIYPVTVKVSPSDSVKITPLWLAIRSYCRNDFSAMTFQELSANSNWAAIAGVTLLVAFMMCVR